MDINILNTAKRIIKVKQSIAQERLVNLKTELLKNGEYKKLSEELKDLTLQISKALRENIDSSQLEKKYNNKKDILNGYEHKAYQNIYNCKNCMDTGINKDGSYCNCLITLYRTLLKENCGMNDLPNNNLSDINPQNLICAQRDKLVECYDFMIEYCKSFPKTTFKNVLLIGTIGVGKTYLASAVANNLLDNGFNVQYFTAFSFNNLLLKYHTSSTTERIKYMDNLINCELLVIDDLGTEPILKNVTMEYLYSILDARNNKHTIITTNLTLKELLTRYEGRIFSRLTNKTNTKIFGIMGEDLRTKK